MSICEALTYLALGAAIGLALLLPSICRFVKESREEQQMQDAMNRAYRFDEDTHKE
jgi:hypothetical protein